MRLIVGVDEVGRGAWAGPVVAGAVILKRPIVGIKDSKLLTKLQRIQMAELIQQKALAVGLGWVWPRHSDTLGLTAAITLAMAQAIEQIKLEYDQIIIDGAFNFLKSNQKATTLIKADQTVPAVSAASIIAKVARDKYMSEAALKYPNYFFEHHVGYGTKLHQNTLRQHGFCEIHRLSYKPIKVLI